MRKQRGFTLIELLIVLAILAILVGIVAMNVSSLTASAKTTGMNAEKEVVQTAIDTYNTQDVAINGSAAIAARAVAAKVTSADADAPFKSYLKRDTKYKYTWAAAGDTLAVTP